MKPVFYRYAWERYQRECQMLPTGHCYSFDGHVWSAWESVTANAADSVPDDDTFQFDVPEFECTAEVSAGKRDLWIILAVLIFVIALIYLVGS